MEPIRVATKEEVKRVAESADLTPTSSVLAFGNDIAVVRSCMELDPVMFDPRSNNARKLLFVWGLENILRANGVTEYYFNIDLKDVAWQRVVEKHGAEQQSQTPEIRYKKLLVEPYEHKEKDSSKVRIPAPSA